MYGGFFSSINFWLDLVNISDVMKNADPKIVVLRTELKKMNEKLPAAVYVPFYSCKINLCSRRHDKFLIPAPAARQISSAPFRCKSDHELGSQQLQLICPT